jgi:S1-C subfamily serine protease
MKIQQKHNQMLFTVATVEGCGSGSGVVIFADDDFTMILTAKHVVEKCDEIDVTFYPSKEHHIGTVVKTSKKRDLAMVMVEGYRHPNVATISTNMTPRVYEPVWKVGGGLGLIPHPAEGIITGLSKVGFMYSAPTIFGDSGGAVFIEDDFGDYHLTGITIAVGARDNQAVPHLGYAHDIATIVRFINSK